MGPRGLPHHELGRPAVAVVPSPGDARHPADLAAQGHHDPLRERRRRGFAGLCEHPLRATPAFYHDPQWGHITDWETELRPTSTKRGGCWASSTTPSKRSGRRREGDRRTIRRRGHVSADAGGVYFGEPGETVPDPYFEGEGPDRAGCIGCGNCMVGCRHNAKNTLDKNYLWFAERNGAVVEPLRQVVDLEAAESDDGPRWIVSASRPGRRRDIARFRARDVIFSAGALGTTRLLLELSERGRLPGISPRLGYQTRTNSEALVGAVARARFAGLLEGDRDHIIDPPASRHAHRTGAIRSGVECPGSARHGARGRRW